MSIQLIFDEDFYLAQNPDVAAAGVDAFTHYMNQGWREGRDPSAFFDTSFYLNQNPDVNAAGVNPLSHFFNQGFTEGRDPSAFFDTSFYLSENPDVAAAGINPLQHYINRATTETFRDPNPFFDTSFYLSNNPDVAAAGINPLQHFINRAADEPFRDPSAFFDTSFYLANNADVDAANVNPLLHFLRAGILEGRDPSAAVDLSSLGTDFQTAVSNGDLAGAVSAIESTAASVNGSGTGTSTSTVTGGTSSGGSGGGGGGGGSNDTFTLTNTDGDNFNGGSGNDVFSVTDVNNFQSNDSLAGGTNVDTLQISNGGTIDLNTPAVFTDFENITVIDNNATNITLDNDDQQNVTGGGGGDTFTIDIGSKNWQAGDSLDGGDGTDTLDIDGASTINLTLADTALNNVENVDMTDASAMTVTLDDDGYNVTMGAAVQVLVTGSGTDSVTLANDDMNVNVGGGDDTVTSAEDAQLDGSDSITGGTGTDRIILNDGSNDGTTVTGAAGDFDGDTTGGGVQGFEIIEFGTTGGGSLNVTMVDAYVSSTDSNAVTLELDGEDLDSLTTTGVTGTVTLQDTSDDTFSATLANGVNHTGLAIAAGQTATINLGDGDVTIAGGTGGETFAAADANIDTNDSITGGTGTDTLSVSADADAIDGTDLDNISGIDVINFTNGGGRSVSDVISDAFVDASDNDSVEIQSGGDLADLDVSNVNSARTIVIGTTSEVTFADGAAQTVTAKDGVDVDLVSGNNTLDVIFNDDNLDANDSVDGSAGTTVTVTVRDGEDDDAITFDGNDLDDGNFDSVDVWEFDETGKTITATITEDLVDYQDGNAGNDTGSITLSFGSNTINIAQGTGFASGETVQLSGTGAVTFTAATDSFLVDASNTNNITLGDFTNTISATTGDLGASDTVTGGSGTDTLVFTDGTTIDFGTSTNVTAFENIDFAADTNTITLTDAFVDSAASDTVTIDASANAAHTIALDASAVNVARTVIIEDGVFTLSDDADRVTLATGTDVSVVGGDGTTDGNDVFVIASGADLTTDDSIDGGDETDTILITGAGASVDLTAAGDNDFANVSNIDQLVLAGANNTVATDNAVGALTYINNGTLAFTSGTTAGNYTVYSTGTVTLDDAAARSITIGDAGASSATAAALVTGDATLDTALDSYTGGTVDDGAHDDQIAGGDGDDTITLDSGDNGAGDTVTGGDGDDTVNITLSTWDGNDDVQAGEGGETNGDSAVLTGAGETLNFTTTGTLTEFENITLNSGAILTFGDEGYNFTLDGVGTQDITSGTGSDTINIAASALDGDISIDAGAGGGTDTLNLTGGGAVSLVTAALTGIEAVTLAAASDVTINAEAFANGVTGSTGNDSFIFDDDANFGTADSLTGGDGDDTLVINDGGDNATIADADIDNIATIETLQLGSSSTGTFAITLGNNADTWIGGLTNDVLDIDLNAQDNQTITLITTDVDAANTVRLEDTSDNVATVTLGAGGSAVTIADGTAASITGGTGSDTVIGGDSNDTIDGGAGDDRITAGTGDDSLTGGDGGDLFFIGETDSNVTTKTVITDFASNGDSDKIVLSDAFFTFGTGEGSKSGAALTGSDIYSVAGFAVGDNSAGDQTFIYDTTDGDLYYDADGDGAGTAVLVLNIQNYFGGAGGNDYFFNATDFVGGA
jgi:hypothetical protein